MPIDPSLLAPVAQPQPFNFAALQQSMLQGQQRDTNLSAGDLAAKGDYQGAAARAFQGGNAPLAGQMFDVGNAQHVAGLTQAIQALTPINSTSDWNKARAAIIQKGGQDPGDFSQKDKVLGQLTDALDPQAAANRKVQQSQFEQTLAKPAMVPIGSTPTILAGPNAGWTFDGSTWNDANGNPQRGGPPSGGQPAAPTGQPVAGSPPAGAPPANRFDQLFGGQAQALPTAGQPPAPAPAQPPPGAIPPAQGQRAMIMQMATDVASYKMDPRMIPAKLKPIVLGMAGQLDPTYSPSLFPGKQATEKSFAASGPDGNNLQSLNNAIGHLGTLDAAVKPLGNSDLPVGANIINGVKNAVTGSGSAGVPQVKFNEAAALVSSEVAKAVKGGAITEGEGRDLQKNITTASSPSVLHAAVQQAVELLSTRFANTLAKYQTTMGHPLDHPILSDKSAAVLQKIGIDPTSIDPGYQPAAGAPQTNKPLPAAEQGKVDLLRQRGVPEAQITAALKADGF